MAAMGNPQTVALQLEKVRDKLPLMYERDDVLLTLMQQRTDVERVSTRSMRIPLHLRPGGKAGQADMDGGDLGRGSGTTYDFATVTPIFFKFAVEITKLVEYATNASEKAIENAAKREVKNGMAQFRSFLDKLLQTAGNGILATVAVADGPPATTYTLGAPFGAQLLYFNQDVQVYDVTLAAARAVTGGGTVTTVTSINYETGVVTVSPSVVASVATDVLVPTGVSGANPVSMFGLKYHQNNSAVGTWLGLNRANYPEVRTPRVNGNSAALTPGQVRLGTNKIVKALGIQALEKLVAYMNVEQAHAWENIGLNISQIIRDAVRQAQPDQLFSGPSTMGGATVKLSVNADPKRVDFLALQHWGRAVMVDIDYFEVGGQTVFPVYGASGGLAAAYLFYYILGMQIWNDNPRAGSYIDTLAVPTGYPVFP